MMRRGLSALVVLGAALAASAPAGAQHERRVAGARYTVPDGWHPVWHNTDAVVASADGAVRYVLMPSRNDFDDTDPDAWLARHALAWAEAERWTVVDRSVPLSRDVLGEPRPALRLLLRRGIELRELLAVLHTDDFRRRVLMIDAAVPVGDPALAAFDAWLATATLHEAPVVSPPPQDGDLDGTFVALRQRTRQSWIDASDAVSPLYAEDDSTRAARDWTTVDVDAYTFWHAGSRLYWGLPEQPLDSLAAAPPGEERQRWSRYEQGGGRLQVWFRFGNEAAFPFQADSASVQVDGRVYARVRPVGSVEELVGIWRHDDVTVSDIEGADGRMRSEETERVTLSIDASSAITMTLARETIQTHATGTSRSAAAAGEVGGTVGVVRGAATLTLGEREPVTGGAYWLGDTLLLGGDAFRRGAPGESD